MRNYGLEMKGGFVGEILTTAPVWTSSDEGRMIYTEDTEKYYYGDGTSWIEISSGSAGTSGTSGSSGSSGTSGAAGTSGTSGTDSGGGGDAANALPLILPNYCSLDDTDDNLSRGETYNMIEAINFADSSNGAIWISVHLPDTIDATADLNMDLCYNLSGSDDSKIVTMETKYWIYGNGITPNPSSPTGTNSDDVSTGTSEDGKRQIETLTPIPNADIVAGNTLTLKITRIGDTDTYTGTLQMLYIYLYQN